MTTPTWIRWLLRHLAGPGRADDILGDLEERHRRRVLRRGSAGARFLTALDFLDLAGSLLRLRYGRRASRDAAPTRAHRVSLEAVVRTLTLALRRIRRAPGFAISVVVILALGIGANAVMFEVVDRLLLSPPQHVVDASEVRLVYVRGESPFGGSGVWQSVSYPDYGDFRGVEAFAELAAYTPVRESTVGRGETLGRAQVAGATASMFPLLGVQPALGQFFPQEEDPLAATPVAVLSHEYWDRRYGRDPEVIGRTLEVGSRSLTVIGIAPAGFTGAQLAPVDIWMPVTQSTGERNLTLRGTTGILVVARLAPGATVEAAEAEATASHRAGREEMISIGRYDADAAVVLAPIVAARGPSPTSEAQVTRWLAGVSLAVLLIACFNVANLLLARSIRARQEIAVRLALGAGRGRLIGEVLTEILLLAVMGAGVSLLFASLLRDSVHEVLLPNVAFTDGPIGGRLLGFTFGATLVTGLLTGLIPALHASRANLSDAIKSGARGVTAGRSKTRVALIVGQVALTVVLLVGAGLFVRSLQTAQGLDLGFDPSNVVVASVEPEGPLEPSELTEIVERALSGVRRLPGVHSAGLSLAVPFRSSLSLTVHVPGLDSIPYVSGRGPYMNQVTSGYFEALGLAMIRGRAFVPADDVNEAPRVSVISESMARAIWPSGDALGACIIVALPRGDTPCHEVVGIVEDHYRQDLLETEPHLQYFVSKSLPAIPLVPTTIMVGTTGTTPSIVDLIRDEARAASSRIRFVNAIPMSDNIEPGMRAWRLGASMFTAFGMLALIVAAWGLYSVLAFDVALREHELGIRSALGAGVRRLVHLVLRQVVLFVAAGVGIGLFVAWSASRFVGPLLFRVSPRDLPIYSLVAVTLLLVALLAGVVPAWRATRVDPREALQAD